MSLFKSERLNTETQKHGETNKYEQIKDSAYLRIRVSVFRIIKNKQTLCVYQIFVLFLFAKVFCRGTKCFLALSCFISTLTI